MTGRRDGTTAPVGYGDDLQPIETVVTTASRLSPIPWGWLFAGTLVAILAHAMLFNPDKKRMRRPRRKLLL